jgi:hypothetical protein
MNRLRSAAWLITNSKRVRELLSRRHVVILRAGCLERGSSSAREAYRRNPGYQSNPDIRSHPLEGFGIGATVEHLIFLGGAG